ncbi:MAG: TonB-dependent receptor [bacterium]
MFYLIASFILTSDTTLVEKYPLYKMEEVVVTATRIRNSLYNLPTNVTLITRDMIVHSNARTVAEAIEYAFGVTEVGNQGTRGAVRNVRIRGGATNQVLVMIDGQSLNDVALGVADLDEIPTDYVERIEIIRGPTSVLYGANALGGVVNIITKNTESAADFQISGGSFFTQKYSANISMKQNKRRALFIISRDVSDGWRKNSDYGGNDFFGKFGNDFEQFGKLGFRFIYHNSEFGVPGQNTTPIYEYDGSQEKEAQSPDARQTRQNEQGQLEYENNIGNTVLQVKTYSNITNKRYEYPTGFTDALTKTHIYGTEVQINTVYDVILGAGVHRDECARKDLTVSPAKIDIDESTTNRSVFLQKISSIGKISTILGVHYDKHSVFGEETNPHASIVCHLLDNLKFSANVGSAFRSPTFEDLYSPYSSWSAGPTWMAGDTKGNTDLKPEKSWGYDIGLEFRIRNIMLSQITLFKNDITNLIQWAEVDPAPNYEKWRPSNVGKAYNQGVELKITQWILPNLEHSLQYNCLENKGKKEGQDDYKTLPYTIPFKLNYMVNYANNAGLGVNINTNFTEQVIWEDDFGAKDTLRSYTLVDTRIGQKVHIKNQKSDNRMPEFFFIVKNIFDIRYQTRKGYPLAGRNFSIGATVTL